ncbi:hypothetical protein MBT84_18335 [Streptomyces sp. MBT84]|uniref:hypothetical protein n=1 Tax=Streptomyces sp. MBT84 TaxID=1488414 RepID=UPI001C6F4A64|nr:hypothetical protein [Streptomyces sp. MBT84]MBW8701568.1 hypothetical protein [Streptomyces sp. MBT84]
MRIRRILAAVIATAALAGLGLTSAATATAASPTPGECEQGGGTVDWATNLCRGGTHDGHMVD